jgi:hypothetical protein
VTVSKTPYNKSAYWFSVGKLRSGHSSHSGASKKKNSSENIAVSGGGALCNVTLMVGH